MMDKSPFLVQTLDESGYSYSDLTALLHKAFEERVLQGIVMSPTKMSVNDFKKKGNDRIVLVAIKAQTHELVGTAMTQILRDNNKELYGYEEYKGILPEYKRIGIGSLLETHLQKIAIEHGASYLVSTTAVKAKSSIRFHLASGFFKWSFISYPDTEYYSIVFRKQLVPDKKWDSLFYRSFHYCLSFFRTIIYKRNDGQVRRWRSLLMQTRPQ